MQYVNAQGVGFDRASDFCADERPPFDTDCNTGAATWMTTEGPAARAWARRWPEVAAIARDRALLGLPAGSALVNNTYCGTPILVNVPRRNLSAWRFAMRGNRLDESACATK